MFLSSLSTFHVYCPIQQSAIYSLLPRQSLSSSLIFFFSPLTFLVSPLSTIFFSNFPGSYHLSHLSPSCPNVFLSLLFTLSLSNSISHFHFFTLSLFLSVSVGVWKTLCFSHERKVLLHCTSSLLMQNKRLREISPRCTHLVILLHWICYYQSIDCNVWVCHMCFSTVLYVCELSVKGISSLMTITD